MPRSSPGRPPRLKGPPLGAPQRHLEMNIQAWSLFFLTPHHLGGKSCVSRGPRIYPFINIFTIVTLYASSLGKLLGLGLKLGFRVELGLKLVAIGI